MRAILDYCGGGLLREVAPTAILIREGERTGHLFVLVEGRLEVVKGDTVVATLTEPGAIVGEMSALLGQPYTATVRAPVSSKVYQFSDPEAFFRSQPEVALLVARMLAQRLNVATTYLADIKRQYAGHGSHLAMVGDVLECMINSPASTVAPGSDRADPRM
ncbi:MAG: cyclic nucleotide-binding domain-containing protein [Bradyrhizobiaceae bacterium]|nr:MAG: cyclic nucleotide-binding domain-containing protein [Bradyrhizobiaceae bacterium]